MKDWILHGISALEFLRTPPCIRELEFPPEVLESLNRASPSYRERSNTPQLILEIRHEIFRSLKGVSIPVHVLTDGIPRGASPYAVWHTRSDDISDDDLEQISDNLYATSPRVALLHLARDCTPVQLAMVMMECCGLYATCPGTSRMQRAINLLDTTCGLPDTTRQLAAFYGLDGKPLAFTDDHGAPLPWSPCRTRDGTISNLWKRPPLCSIEQLAKFSKSLGPVHGAKTFRRALEMVVRVPPLRWRPRLLSSWASTGRRVVDHRLPAYRARFQSACGLRRLVPLRCRPRNRHRRVPRRPLPALAPQARPHRAQVRHRARRKPLTGFAPRRRDGLAGDGLAPTHA